MENGILVSIIISVYNVEEFIEECIKSVIRQSYETLQIILVDDGSTDRSAELCKKYQRCDPRIEFYQIQNSGVSTARNIGISHARGKYLFFVDSDDMILDNYIQNFMECGDAPFIGAGYRENSVDGTRFEYQDCLRLAAEYKKNSELFWEEVPCVHVTGNRYSRDIIVENNICFEKECTLGEDSRFNMAYLSCVDSVRVISQSGYIYRLHEGSLIHRFWPDRLEIEKQECIKREAFFEGAMSFGFMKYIHWNNALEHLYFYSTV
ncbi:glycosyltransferase, partial [Faecalicatena contorta]|uniref:glycosyltransferase n=1 Tax=Faecalicatena contorta TaxID=39482 RepID=UPI001F2108E4